MKIRTVNGYYFLGLILSMTAVVEGARLSCIQCRSDTNPYCGDPDYEIPTPCRRSDNYCMTLRVLSENGGEAVVKGCNRINFNGCIVHRMGEIDVTLCYKSCEIDGCNTSILK